MGTTFGLAGGLVAGLIAVGGAHVAAANQPTAVEVAATPEFAAGSGHLPSGEVCVVYDLVNNQCAKWEDDGQGGGSSGGDGGSQSGGESTGDSSSGSSGSSNGSSGGDSQSGSNSGGGSNTPAPEVPWHVQIARAHPQSCAAEHPIIEFLSPADTADADADIDSSAVPETQILAEFWTAEDFVRQLDRDRNPHGTTESERGSGRLIHLVEECPGLLAPIDRETWLARGWSVDDYDDYWDREGQAPTDLELVVNDQRYNITPNTEQWADTLTYLGVVHDRAFDAAGITAEQFQTGEGTLD